MFALHDLSDLCNDLCVLGERAPTGAAVSVLAVVDGVAQTVAGTIDACLTHEDQRLATSVYELIYAIAGAIDLRHQHYVDRARERPDDEPDHVDRLRRLRHPCATRLRLHVPASWLAARLRLA